ncbi:MAG: helix-turn-helix domain-containing protein [Clostridia bacterium]|nr:helix-turn-helix domain-containing protein [Clostridia bacterium]
MKLYIGETIKRLRQQNGLTQEQLADKLGVSFQSISRWEGGTSYPDIELIPVIAMSFQVTTDELMGLEKSFLDKKREEALKQLEGNIPAKERVEIQRQIYRDFPHDPGVLYGLIQTLGELCEEGQEREYYEEMKQLAEIYLSIPGEQTWSCDMVKTELVAAAPENEVDRMIKKYASVNDLRTGAMLKKRYEYRRDRKRCEQQTNANLVEAVHDIVFGVITEATNPAIAVHIHKKVFKILNILSDQDENDLIPSTPDIWCYHRMWLGASLAMNLCRVPELREASLDVLESSVTLGENAFSLPDKTELVSESDGLNGISVYVSSCPPTKIYSFNHPLFVYRNLGKEFKKIHTAFRPKWLQRWEFEPIRSNTRFLKCVERVQKLTEGLS